MREAQRTRLGPTTHIGHRQAVQGPQAGETVRGDGEGVVCVLRADDLDLVDGMRVALKRQGRLVHRQRFGPNVPEEHLARVRAADDQVRLVRHEPCSQDRRLCPTKGPRTTQRVRGGLGAPAKARRDGTTDLGLEDVFRPLGEVQTPHNDLAARLVGLRRVGVVGRQQELRVLGRPVQVRHHAVLRQPRIREAVDQLDLALGVTVTPPTQAPRVSLEDKEEVRMKGAGLGRGTRARDKGEGQGRGTMDKACRGDGLPAPSQARSSRAALRPLIPSHPHTPHPFPLAANSFSVSSFLAPTCPDCLDSSFGTHLSWSTAAA